MPKTLLKAIMFTDIVGYTTMMQQDRDRAISAVKAYETALKSLIDTHQGELVQTYGDGSLSTFDSAFDAVMCARAVQEAVIGKVPLRIGVHVGEITLDGDHIFGTGINVCSRIESMGVAGALLVSKEVHQKVQNRQGLEFVSLGKHHFKNVAEPMEVLALGNAPLVVPKRKELSGKMAPKRKVQPYVILLGLLLGLLITGGIWWSQSESEEPVSTLEGTKISVIPFTDQTHSDQFSSFGALISDWLSTRLMDIEGTAVMRPANIQQQVAEAQEAGASQFAKVLQNLTGVDLIVEGNYYLLDGSLIINASILNIAKNEIVKSFEVKGPQEERFALLESIGQKVLGYWAIRDVAYLQQRPPKYEAYKLYEEAKPLMLTDPEEAIVKFKRATEIDSAFLPSLFSLHSVYSGEGRDREQDSIFEEITRRKSSFTRLDQLNYSQLVEIRRNNWLGAAQISEQAFKMDPSNVSAALRSQKLYLYANYAQKSLDLWESIDPRFIRGDGPELDWQIVGPAFAYFQLGRYAELDQLARSYQRPKIPDGMAVIHLQSLMLAGRYDRLEEELARYLEEGLYSNSGELTPPGLTITFVCDELYLANSDSLLEVYVAKLEAWNEQQSTHDPAYLRDKGVVAFYRKEYANALTYWEQEQTENQSWPGWLRKPLKIEHQSRLAYCSALLGDTERAEAYLASIAAEPDSISDIISIKAYYSARIHTSLGNFEQACNLLEKSVNAGMSFFRPQVFRHDPFLKPLWEYPEFLEMTAVKE